jgi:hypothetical protein
MQDAPSGAFFWRKLLPMRGKRAANFGLPGLRSERARQSKKSTRMWSLRSLQ